MLGIVIVGLETGWFYAYNGKFNIKYNYDDVLNSGYRSYETQKIWMYEVMGVEPTDEEGKALIQRYLKSKEKEMQK